MDFNSHIDSTLNTLLENTKFLKEMGAVVSEFDDGEYAKMMEERAQQLVADAEGLIGLKSKHKALDQELRQCANESSTIEELEKNWPKRQQATEKKTTNVKNTTEYKNFKKTMEEKVNGDDAGEAGSGVGDDDDDDIMVEDDMEAGGEIFSMHDPWSKALMRNPVRNTHCRHLYDRDSVYAVIKDNLGIRCPVLGCANKKYIQPGHLVPDPKVQQIVRKRIAEEAQEQLDYSSEDEDN